MNIDQEFLFFDYDYTDFAEAAYIHHMGKIASGPLGDYKEQPSTSMPIVIACSVSDYHNAGQDESEDVTRLLTVLEELGLQLPGTLGEKAALGLALNSKGYATITAAVKSLQPEPGPVALAIYDDLADKTGNAVFARQTGLSFPNGIGAGGPKQANRFRNFQFHHRLGMAFNEVMPEHETMREDIACYSLFRSTHTAFSKADDTYTGETLFAGHTLAALSEDHEHMRIVAGWLPDEATMAMKLEATRQLMDVVLDPEPDADTTLTAQARRAALIGFSDVNSHRKAHAEAVRKLDLIGVSINRPVTVAETMGSLMAFQERLIKGGMNTRFAWEAQRLASLPVTDDTHLTFGEGMAQADYSAFFDHLQTFISAAHGKALEGLLGKTGKDLLPTRSRARAMRFLKPEPPAPV